MMHIVRFTSLCLQWAILSSCATHLVLTFGCLLWEPWRACLHNFNVNLCHFIFPLLLSNCLIFFSTPYFQPLTSAFQHSKVRSQKQTVIQLKVRRGEIRSKKFWEKWKSEEGSCEVRSRKQKFRMNNGRSSSWKQEVGSRNILLF